MVFCPCVFACVQLSWIYHERNVCKCNIHSSVFDTNSHARWSRFHLKILFDSWNNGMEIPAHDLSFHGVPRCMGLRSFCCNDRNELSARSLYFALLVRYGLKIKHFFFQLSMLCFFDLLC